MDDNNINNPIVDVTDQSLQILGEVFDNLDCNLYLDFKNKLDVIIDIYNNGSFLAKSNIRIQEIINNFKRLPEMFETLRIETMNDLNISVFKGVCTLKKNLDKIVMSLVGKSVLEFDVYEFLNSLASETFKEFFDEDKGIEEKIDKLYSTIFDWDYMIENRDFIENGKDVGNEGNKNIDQMKNEFNELLFTFISKLTHEFKPLEKKLKMLQMNYCNTNNNMSLV